MFPPSVSLLDQCCSGGCRAGLTSSGRIAAPPDSFVFREAVWYFSVCVCVCGTNFPLTQCSRRRCTLPFSCIVCGSLTNACLFVLIHCDLLFVLFLTNLTQPLTHFNHVICVFVPPPFLFPPPFFFFFFFFVSSRQVCLCPSRTGVQEIVRHQGSMTDHRGSTHTHPPIHPPSSPLCP